MFKLFFSLVLLPLAFYGGLTCEGKTENCEISSSFEYVLTESEEAKETINEDKEKPHKNSVIELEATEKDKDLQNTFCENCQDCKDCQENDIN